MFFQFSKSTVTLQSHYTSNKRITEYFKRITENRKISLRSRNWTNEEEPQNFVCPLTAPQSINLSSMTGLQQGRGEISGREISCIIWSALIGITDGSFAAEKVPGGGDKIFRARHQPRPGKLDSSGVGKPPLLLRRWGKVIREWDLCKAKEKRLYFQDFVRRDTRWIPTGLPPSLISPRKQFLQ